MKFKTEFCLKRHKAYIHSVNVQWHPCDSCDMKFKTSGDMKMHKARIHLVDTTWIPCGLCDKKFKTNFEVKLHQKHIHSIGIEWQECSRCDRKFKTRGDLRKHKIRHHDENVIWKDCSECDKRFKTNHDLKQHWILHHASIEHKTEKKYRQICSVCFVTWLAYGSLQRKLGKCARCLGHMSVEKHVIEMIRKAWSETYEQNIDLNDQKKDAGYVQGLKKRFPDAYVVGELKGGWKRFCDIEIDEESHKSYDVACELSKHSDTLDALQSRYENMEVVFLRIGVNYNKVDSEELKKNVQTLCERLHYYLFENLQKLPSLYVDGFPAKTGVEYIGYDHRGEKHIEAVRNCPQTVLLGKY